MRYMIANLILALLPPTRFFGMKRVVLRLLGIAVGERTSVCGKVRFFGGGRVTIGSDCWIGIATAFYTAQGGNVRIGDGCDVAPESCFHTGSHVIAGRARRAGPGTMASINVGDGCWVGLRATVMAGSVIGDGCVVAAGSLVLGKTYPADSMILGSPARVVRALPE